jgi:acetate kinase
MGDASDHTIVLALNSGSSSLKLALYSFCNGEVSKLASAAAEEIGGEAGKVWLRCGSRLLIDESRSCAGATEATKYLITVLRNNSFPTPQIVGHRIVHGGPHLRKHERITPKVLRQLEKAIVFAPLHLPPALHVLRQAMSDFPDAPHIACFEPFIAQCRSTRPGCRSPTNSGKKDCDATAFTGFPANRLFVRWERIWRSVR